MSKEMLINVSEGEECRIALLQNGRLDELYMERTSSTSHVGNVYKGRVTNVEASIQAAFVDFGLNRNGFLHISDLMPTYFGRRGEDVQESVGRKMARRDRPPIQRCLRRGDEIVVQIIKEGIGTKGPTLTTYLSIPGRILVMMPGMGKLGVSRKIEDEDERRRLRQILDSLDPPKDCGFIIRTAGVGKTKADIQRDLNYLTRLWTNMSKKRDSVAAPVELYTEGDLVTRTVRDVFSNDIDRIVIDNRQVEEKVREFFKIATPRTRNRVEFYGEPLPLFHAYGIEKEIEQMYSRHVPLPSGGSLVIDSTEAIVAIDVNSGKFRDHSDAEMTAFKTDMEAADEIPRQLRLRDLGGVIICDFIDLRFERNRRELEKKLHENLRTDRAKTKMLRMSQFGIIEMTRQRMRPSLKRSIYFDCPHCKGAGLVKTPESMGLDVMRRLAIAFNDGRVQRIEMSICAEVAMVLQNRKRGQLAAMERQTGKHVLIRPDVSLGMDDLKLELFDARDGLVFLEELGMSPQSPQGHLDGERESHRGDRRHQQGQQRGRNQQARRPAPEDARTILEDEMDRAEDAVERREDDYDDDAPVTPAHSAPAMPPQRQSRPQQQQQQQQERHPQNQPPRQPQNQPQRQSADRGPVRQEPVQGPGEPMPADGEPMPADGEPGTPAPGQPGSGRRRRRRRGRRGRGRGTQGSTQVQGFEGHDPAGQGIAHGPGGADERDESTDMFADSAEETDGFDEGSVPGSHLGANEPTLDDGPAAMDDEVVDLETAPQDPSDEPDLIDAVPAEMDSRDGPAKDAPPVRDEPASQPAKAAEPVAAPAEPAAADEAEAEESVKPKAKRRRGTRGGQRRKTPAKKSAASEAGDKTDEGEGGAPAGRAAKSPATPPAKTGSSDKHLSDDEPVFHPPTQRPRTYRDLDQIPDDYE